MDTTGDKRQVKLLMREEYLRCKKKLWREHGRQQLESFRLAPWASDDTLCWR